MVNTSVVKVEDSGVTIQDSNFKVEFGTRHTGLRVNIQTLGVGRGFTLSLDDTKALIGFFSALKTKEQK